MAQQSKEIMHISLFTDGLFPLSIGGMQKHSSLLCKYLCKAGAKVDVYHPHQKGEIEVLMEKLEFEPYEGLSFFSVPFPSYSSLPGHYFVESFVHAKKMSEPHLERIRQSDLVYAQGFTAWAYAQERKKDTTLPPVIMNFHGLEMYQLSFGLKQNLIYQSYKPFVKKNLLSADYAQSLGGKLTGILEGIGVKSDQILSLPIGIPEKWLAQEVTIQNKKRRFVFVGRYERRKGTEELTQAIKALLEKKSFAFDFIGNIPEENRIQHPQITYWGLVKEEENIKRLLTEADVLVCPSYAEGMPTVILEGMARGCAIIATDVGAVSEVVDNNVGWLIKPGNVPLLTETIQEAIQIDEEALNMKKKAAHNRIAEKFIWEKVIDRMMGSFSEILNIPSAPLANVSK